MYSELVKQLRETDFSDGCPCEAEPMCESKDCVIIQAADAIEELSKPKWIPVTERLPESGKESVLIALRWGEVDIGWCEDGRWRSEFVNEYEDGEVTHWMPLPEPPKGE